MTTYGVAYWGIDPKRASKDAVRIAAAGFSWVNMPISEEQMTHNHAGRRQIVGIFRHFGLEVRLSPWGVGGLFGGEGIQSMRNPTDAIDEWLVNAERLAPDAIYWDEPKGIHGASAIECADTALPEHVYLNPKVGIAPSADTLARMASIGIDCYDWNIQRTLDEACGLRLQHSKPIHVWVCAFRIPAVQSSEPGHMMDILTERGVDDVAIWGYPSPGVSCLNNDRPRKVWRAITDAMEATCCSSS